MRLKNRWSYDTLLVYLLLVVLQLRIKFNLSMKNTNKLDIKIPMEKQLTVSSFSEEASGLYAEL